MIIFLVFFLFVEGIKRNLSCCQFYKFSESCVHFFFDIQTEIEEAKNDSKCEKFLPEINSLLSENINFISTQLSHLDSTYDTCNLVKNICYKVTTK